MVIYFSIHFEMFDCFKGYFKTCIMIQSWKKYTFSYEVWCVRCAWGCPVSRICMFILVTVHKNRNYTMSMAHFYHNHARINHFYPDLKSLHWLKIQDRITYKILMLTYKLYYNIAPTYLCELISRRESSVNTRLGADYHQLIMPPISKDCLNTVLERSFIYVAPCEWTKLSECIRMSNFDSFRKSVKTMLFAQQL